MPTQTLTGKVLFANNTPAPGVKVRVFDRDIGSGDDDLTTAEGLSNNAGDFTVQFDPSRFQDYYNDTKAVWELTSPPTWSNPTGTWGWVNHTVSLPDLTDTYSPYLRLSYSINGQPRVQTASLQPFQTQFTLPDFPPPAAAFRPSAHGFNFNNSFPGYALPFTVPGLPNLPGVPASYGLCGGMSTAAADFFWASSPIPAATAAPAQGSPLHQFIYQRQMDTFGGGGYVKKFADWMALPDGTPLGTRRRTADEFAQLRAQLDAHKLVVLGLVYVSLPAPIWNNHQVLAYAYQQASSNAFTIRIYDPNFNNDDTITIEAQLLTVGVQTIPGIPPRIRTIMGLQCMQHTPDGQIPVRGFFIMPYQPVTPPAGL
jgi:hypothetical protein